MQNAEKCWKRVEYDGGHLMPLHWYYHREGGKCSCAIKELKSSLLNINANWVPMIMTSSDEIIARSVAALSLFLKGGSEKEIRREKGSKPKADFC